MFKGTIMFAAGFACAIAIVIAILPIFHADKSGSDILARIGRQAKNLFIGQAGNAPTNPQKPADAPKPGPAEMPEQKLVLDLQTVRTQLAHYKLQHLDKGPHEISGVGLDGSRYAAQLTSKTNENGTFTGLTPYGPYITKIPANPFAATRQSEIKMGEKECPGDGDTGWYVNVKTGRFSPNDSWHKDI